MAYIRSGGPIGGRTARGGEPTRDSSPVKGDAAWRGINRQNTKADGKYGQAEYPNREQGDGSRDSRGGAMPSSVGGSIGSLKSRDSSPPKSERRFDTTYRVQPPAPKLPTTSTASKPVTVQLSRDEIAAALELFIPLGYDCETAVKKYAERKLEIETEQKKR